MAESETVVEDVDAGLMARVARLESNLRELLGWREWAMGQAAPAAESQFQRSSDGVLYVEGTQEELKEVFPFGPPKADACYVLACVEVGDNPDKPGVSGARLVLLPINLKIPGAPGSPIQTPDSRIVLPR